MDISNEELFQSALSDEQPEVTEQETTGQPRDEQGRWAEKPEQPEAKPEAQETKPAAEQQQQESRGVRELREALERSERRAMDFERRLASMQPKPEAQPKPDLFEKPDEFVRQGVREQVDPVKAQIDGLREFFSRERAIDKFGEEKVVAAYSALDRAAASGDPMALATVQAIKDSMHPFGDIVAWHTKNEVGSDPNAYFQKRLDEALKDEKFKGELLSKLQPTREEKPRPVFSAPSLNRAATAAPALEEGGDFSNESLFAAAMR